MVLLACFGRLHHVLDWHLLAYSTTPLWRLKGCFWHKSRALACFPLTDKGHEVKQSPASLMSQWLSLACFSLLLLGHALLWDSTLTPATPPLRRPKSQPKAVHGPTQHITFLYPLP